MPAAALERVLDLVQMVPPMIREGNGQAFQAYAPAVCLGGAALVMVALLRRSLVSSGGGGLLADHPFAGSVVVLLVVLLGFLGMSGETWSAIIHAAYVPLVLAFRLLQGVLLGSLLRRWSRLLALVAPLLVVGAGLALLAPLTLPQLELAQGAWVLLGVGTASLGAVRRAGDGLGRQGHGGDGLLMFGLFVVFLSTTLAVTTAQPLDAVYRWLFPAGYVLGALLPSRGAAA